MMQSEEIEITPFPQGKRIALTTSWDDGPVEDRRLIESFDNWGLKGTFNINSGPLRRTGKPAPDGQEGCVDASEVARIYAGHEVAIHTVTHPTLPKLDEKQIEQEVMDDRKALEDLVSYPVRGMAYPFGRYDSKVIDVLRRLDITYCRTVENKQPCFPPKEPLAWGVTAYQLAENPTVSVQWKMFYENPSSTGVFSIFGHAWEFTRNIGWPALEQIYKPMSGHADVWYCTNIELFDYESARRRIAIAANGESAFNPSAIAVALRCRGMLIDAAPGKVTTLK